MTTPSPPERDWLAEIRRSMREVAPSGIVEVFNYGLGRQGLIPLWVGEGDLPAPDFVLCDGLAATGRVRFFEPAAAFYLFCAVDGFSDSRALAFRLIHEAGVGAAPGSAFGPGGEGFLRLCFARNPAQIEEATRRMARWLSK